MALDAGGVISSALVDRLLARSTTPERGTDLLRAEGLLDAEGLGRLLDAAEELVYSDPGKTHRLAELCAAGAEARGLPALKARSSYVLTITHLGLGAFDAALRLARDGARQLADDPEG